MTCTFFADAHERGHEELNMPRVCDRLFRPSELPFCGQGNKTFVVQTVGGDVCCDEATWAKLLADLADRSRLRRFLSEVPKVGNKSLTVLGIERSALRCAVSFYRHGTLLGCDGLEIEAAYVMAKERRFLHLKLACKLAILERAHHWYEAAYVVLAASDKRRFGEHLPKRGSIEPYVKELLHHADASDPLGSPHAALDTLAARKPHHPDRVRRLHALLRAPDPTTVCMPASKRPCPASPFGVPHQSPPMPPGAVASPALLATGTGDGLFLAPPAMPSLQADQVAMQEPESVSPAAWPSFFAPAVGHAAVVPPPPQLVAPAPVLAAHTGSCSVPMPRLPPPAAASWVPSGARSAAAPNALNTLSVAPELSACVVAAAPPAATSIPPLQQTVLPAQRCRAVTAADVAQNLQRVVEAGNAASAHAWALSLQANFPNEAQNYADLLGRALPAAGVCDLNTPALAGP